MISISPGPQELHNIPYITVMLTFPSLNFFTLNIVEYIVKNILMLNCFQTDKIYIGLYKNRIL